MSKPREPKSGERLSAADAKAYVDYLYSTHEEADMDTHKLGEGERKRWAVAPLIEPS